MTPELAIQSLQMALGAVMGCAVLLWMLPGPCRCAQCAFHTNERRMKALQKEEARQTQMTLDHDADHKGFGFKDGAPDRYNCADESCKRNPTRVD